MRPLELGIVLPLLEDPATGQKRTWGEIRSTALRAEELGFDTVWVADELLWTAPIVPWPQTMPALDALAPLLASLDTAI